MELGLIVSPEHDLDMYWYLLVLYFCVAQVLLAVEENKKSRPPGNLLYLQMPVSWRTVVVVARGCGYNTIAFMSDAVDGRSAERGRNAIVRQNPRWPAKRVTFFVRFTPTLGCGTS